MVVYERRGAVAGAHCDPPRLCLPRPGHRGRLMAECDNCLARRWDPTAEKRELWPRNSAACWSLAERCTRSPGIGWVGRARPHGMGAMVRAAPLDCVAERFSLTPAASAAKRSKNPGENLSKETALPPFLTQFRREGGEKAVDTGRADRRAEAYLNNTPIC